MSPERARPSTSDSSRATNPSVGSRRQAAYGALALTTTKAADALTTVIGLDVASLREANPLVRAAMADVGTLPALLSVGLATVVAVVIITETAAGYLRRRRIGTRRDRTYVRLVGYGIPSLLHVAVSVQNATLLLSAAG